MTQAFHSRIGAAEPAASFPLDARRAGLWADAIIAARPGDLLARCLCCQCGPQRGEGHLHFSSPFLCAVCDEQAAGVDHLFGFEPEKTSCMPDTARSAVSDRWRRPPSLVQAFIDKAAS